MPLSHEELNVLVDDIRIPSKVVIFKDLLKEGLIDVKSEALSLLVVLLIEKLLSELLQGLLTSVCVPIDLIIVLGLVQILETPLSVLLEESGLNQTLRGAPVLVLLLATLRMLQVCLNGSKSLAGLLKALCRLFKVHLCFEIVRRPLEETCLDSAFPFLVGLLCFFEI